MSVTCQRCNAVFDTRDEFLEHRKYPCGDTNFAPITPTVTTSNFVTNVAQPPKYVCERCGKSFETSQGLNGHVKAHYGRPRKPRAKKMVPVQVADDVPDARMVCPECGTLWEIYGPVEMEVCPTCSSDLFAVGETRTVRVVVQ